MQEYTKSFVEFRNDKVNLDSFTLEIEASDISVALSSMLLRNETSICYIWFESQMTSEDETIFDTIVANHLGLRPTAFGYRAPSNLVIGITAITEDSAWQEIAGTVTNLAAFVRKGRVENAWGRCVGEFKVSGEGAQLRMIRESDGVQCMAEPYAFTNGDTWEKFQFWANQGQLVGHERYVLQGRLNGATSFSVRDVIISILEKV